METGPIYSRPMRAGPIRTGPIKSGEKMKSLDPTTEAVKKISSKYDSFVVPQNSISTNSSSSVRQKRFIETDPVEEGLSEVTEQDIMQMESFYRSNQTQVFVCECLANLYHMNMGPSSPTLPLSNRSPGPASSASSWSSGRSDTSSECDSSSVSLASSPDWELARTGIPVLLFDKGQSRARSKRRLQIALAERGSGFALWYDVLDNLSNYRALAPTFHAMHYSGDHRQMAGLSFDRSSAAAEFLRRVELLTSDPLNISLSVPKTRSSSKRRTKRSKSAGPASRGNNRAAVVPKPKPKGLPTKSDISLPCCFQHVTSVDLSDREKLYSLATLVDSFDKVSLSPEGSSFSRATSSSSLAAQLPLRTRSSSDIFSTMVG